MNGIVRTLILVAAIAGHVQAQVDCGDCNQDGFATDILDALASAQISAGVLMPTGEQPCACDVNDDGMITIIDTLLMAQVSAGLPVTLTCPAPICGVAFNTPPEVIINQPMAGASLFGVILVDFDTIDIDGDMLDVTIEYSTNAGASFFLASNAGGGSVAMNPTGPLPAAVGQTFNWDSNGDGVAPIAPFITVIRVTADDGTATSSAEVIVTLDNRFPCGPPAMCAGTLMCGAGFNLGFGTGTEGIPPVCFDFATDSIPVSVDTSGRAPGDAVDIFITNLSDDHDLYIGLPGTVCGDPDPANYVLANVGGGSGGTGDELHILGDRELIARGEVVNVVVYHFDPSPMSTCDVAAICRTIEPCDGTLACGDPPLVGSSGNMGGPMGALPMSGQFTPGAMGDSYFLEVDFTGLPAGSGLGFSITNQTVEVGGLLQVPVAPCGYQDTYSWQGVQTFNDAMGNDFLLMTPDELALYPDGFLPMVIYNVDPGPGNFDIGLRCPALGPCEGTLQCGDSMVAGQIDMGTSYMYVGGQHTFGPGGDADSWIVDLSGRAPDEAVTMTLRSLTSDCDLFVLPLGMPCGWPLPWNQGASQNPGVGVDDVLIASATELTCFGIDQFVLVVYRPDPMGTGDYDLSVTCAATPPSCAGTVEGVIDEAVTPVPINVMGNTTGADDTVPFDCGIGGSIGGADHIYEFIPSVDGIYSFTLCGSPFDTSLQIVELDCLAGAVLACDDDGCGPAFESVIPGVCLSGGVSYYIVVDGWNGDVGAYSLDIDRL